MTESVNVEKCQRCGVADVDLRTLRMSCLYAMEELGLPFYGVTHFGLVKVDATKPSELIKHLTPVGSDPEPKLRSGRLVCGPVNTESKLYPVDSYCLRVCKDCRAGWMEAIKTWFNSGPESQSDEVRDIPVRVLGSVKMVSRREYDEMQTGR